MLTRSIFRALCALFVGFLLVSNPAGMSLLLVQVIGGIFAASGIVAVIGYFTQRARQSGFRPVFPIVGIGSVAFGLFLLLFPGEFVNILMYILGALLILIGIGQISGLVINRTVAPLSWTLFILPVLTTLAGVFVIAYPIAAASIPFTILGIAYLVYGAGELIIGIRFYHFRRLFDATMAAQAAQEANEVSDADAVEIIEEN